MKDVDLEKRIIELLSKEPRTALTQKEISNGLELKGKLRKQLQKQLNRLVKHGSIVSVRQGRFSIGEEIDLYTGRLSAVRSGNGFVESLDGGREGSVFISSRDMGTALSGDVVLVRIFPESRDDERGPSGKIIRIVERARHDIVGTLRSTGRFLYVVPIDPAFSQDFYVADGCGAKPGERVLVRFSHWTNRHVSPEAEVLEVLGSADDPSVDTLSIIRHHDLRDEFPEEVLREAESASAKVELPGKRIDLRDDLIITIDPDKSRDFDDALSMHVEGDYRIVGIHIADVSHFVTPGSELDKEARLRGTSVYFPDKVLPMLPEQLSNGICSLNPGRDRLTFSVMLKVDREGSVVGRWFAKSIIRSKARLTYREALAVLENRREAVSNEAVTDAVCALLKDLHHLAQQFRKLRYKQHALELDLPEFEIETDGNGRMIGIVPTENDISHQLVEECMVAANEAVAAELAARHIASIARFHDEPTPAKIEELTDMLLGMGYSPGDLSKQRSMARFLLKIKDDPLSHHIHVAVLKSMSRAVYSSTRTGHYGLAKTYYSHFTSPIRRYPDLVVHRQLGACMNASGGQRYDRAQLASFAAHATEREEVCDTAERNLMEIMKFRYLASLIETNQNAVFDAVVVAVTNFGVFVELENLRVQGLVHVSSLSGEFLRYDRGKGELRNRFDRYAIGDSLRVRVADVDMDARKLTFEAA